MGMDRSILSNNNNTQQVGGQGFLQALLDILTLDYDILPPTVMNHHRIMMGEMESYHGSSSSSFTSAGVATAASPFLLGNTYITCSIVRIIQRIHVQDVYSMSSTSSSSTTYPSLEEDISSSKSTSWEDTSSLSLSTRSASRNSTSDTIWALLEYEITLPDASGSTNSSGDIGNLVSALVQTLKLQQQQPQSNSLNNTTLSTQSYYRFQRWKRFISNNQLLDHIRKDRGEPIAVPPFSLSPHQAIQVTNEAKKQVESITEEYRKFRVKAEITRKQAEETIRMLQQNQVQVTQDRFTAMVNAAAATTQTPPTTTSSSSKIHHPDLYNDTHSYELERLQNELIQQEGQWKKMYDDLVAENIKLKSSASEGFIASQWRHRYEQVCKERDNWKTKCEVYAIQSSSSSSSSSSVELLSKGDTYIHNGYVQNSNNSEIRTREEENYESKYRDLKESFRLYRKKAKEIFDAQQRGDSSVRGLFSFH